MGKNLELEELTHEESRRWWETLPFGIGLVRGSGHRGGTTKPRAHRKTRRDKRKAKKAARKAQR